MDYTGVRVGEVVLKVLRKLGGFTTGVTGWAATKDVEGPDRLG